MKKALAMTLLATGLFAATASADETLRYNWRLRGALAWVARVKFPTSGTGVLQTSPKAAGVASQLRVSAGGNDYLEYQTLMDQSARRTLTSANGYSFGSRSERKETVYDYSTKTAHVAEREQGALDTKTRPLPVDEARDVLTTIAYLREHASSIHRTITTAVYADGKPYDVVIEPKGVESMEWQGRQVSTRVFRVAAAPGAKKKFGGMTVWLSEDAQRLPLRIVLEQQYASIDLRLKGA